MKIVKLELPSALLEAASFQAGDASRETARLLALKLYREDKVSLGRASEFCRTPLAAFTDFAAGHGVPPLRYTLEDLDEAGHSASLVASRRKRPH